MQEGVRSASWYTTCVACGARYHPKFFVQNPAPGRIGKVLPASDHICNPAKLRQREEALKHEFDDDEAYCECDELDCKFEYAEQLRCELE